MAIPVICPSCKAQFNVSDKFAGKKGPCPKCKAEITVPEKSEEVQIHAPEDFDSGGRDSAGRLVLKPIARTEFKVSPIVIVAIVGATIVTFGVAWMLGSQHEDKQQIPTLLLGLGAVLVAPPLVFGGYSFLRDDDLQPYRGTSLYIRIGICAMVYALLWGLNAVTMSFLFGATTPELWNLILVIPPFIAAGAVAAFACLDLDFTTATFHYGFYLTVTVLLRLTMGMAPI